MNHIASVAVLSLLALAACNRPAQTVPPADAPAVQQPDAAPTTVPVDPNTVTADGLGPIHVGLTIPEVEAVWGPPATAITDATGCNLFHPARAPEGVTVMTESGLVSRITLGIGAALKTDRGFGVGDMGSAVRQAYGGAIVSIPAKYDPAPAEDLIAWRIAGSTQYVTDPAARGIRYEVGTDGKVKAIHAGGPSIQLAESCG